jgi:hypothetical protein
MVKKVDFGPSIFLIMHLREREGATRFRLKKEKIKIDTYSSHVKD